MSGSILRRFTGTMFSLAMLAIIVLTLSGSASAAGYPGHVYTETNASSGNQVLAYGRAADGGLTFLEAIDTGGLGTGAGLGSQGALAISGDRRWLIAVNAGSNDISVISLATGVLYARVSSGGTLPVGVTEHNHLVYVLNAGSGNISGFWLRADGSLSPVVGSTLPLAGAGPAEIKFTRDGRALVVTEKATSTIDTFAVDQSGVASGPYNHPSSGAVPFGFDFGLRNTLVVSEAAASAASSYRVARDGGLTLITGSLVNGQQAACWVAVTHDGRFAYTADAHNGQISSYAIASDGSLSLLDGTAGSPGGAPLDEAVSADDRFLYVLNPSLAQINAFSIDGAGNLDQLGNTGGIPASAAGLVAR